MAIPTPRTLPVRGAPTALAAFLSVLFPLSASAGVPFDFDGDGRADVLWRDASRGVQQLWLMNGATAAQAGALDAQPDRSWRLEALGDFDGNSRADLLWRHAGSGQNEIWFMNAFAVVSRLALPTLSDTDWRVAATADFDGDGRTDILWRHEAAGSHGVWRMGAAGPSLPAAWLPRRPLAWRVAAAGDFDGDGRADLLWRQHVSGAVEVCLTLAPASHACSAAAPVDANVRPRAQAADMNGDQKADVVWHADSGNLLHWTMNGTVVSASSVITWPRQGRLLQLADFDGDGRADLLWSDQPKWEPQARTRSAYVWLMNGATPTQQATQAIPTSRLWSAGPDFTPLPPIFADPPGDVPQTPAEAVRFLDQATFGATPALVAQVQQSGFTAFLDQQFAAPRSTYYDFVAAAPTTNDSARINALRTRFFMNALAGQDQLRQRVALALSQSLVVSSTQINDGPGLALYADLLAQHAFGNYRQLLHGLTLNPAMGDYLDAVNNLKPNPATGRQANENYARELMQLFSIGLTRLHPNGLPQLGPTGAPLPTYDQDVVDNLARVFTGWTYAPQPGAPPQPQNPRNYLAPMVLWPSNHDTNAKTILNGRVLPAGQTGEQDLADTLDEIFNHPNLGPFVGRQLIQHLVTSNPSPGYVARVTSTFNGVSTGVRGDLQATVRAVLLDPEARRDPGADTNFGRLREPLQFILNVLRGLGASGQGYGLVTHSSEMSQNPFGPPSVFSFYSPGYRLPGTALQAPPFQIYAASTAMRRANYVNRIVYGTISLPSYAPPGSTSVSIDYSPWINLAGDPAALVADLDARLMGGRMSPGVRAAIVAAVTATSATRPIDRAKTAVYLVATSPHYQVQR